jgi:hypothetical protein
VAGGDRSARGYNPHSPDGTAFCGENSPDYGIGYNMLC